MTMPKLLLQFLKFLAALVAPRMGPCGDMVMMCWSGDYYLVVGAV